MMSMEYIKENKNYYEEKINELNDKVKYYQNKTQRQDKEIERLNNIIDELKWKPIEQYEKPKYDWVLVKYYIGPNFECIPAVAEKRFGKWYNRNDEEIIGDVRYFMDMQQLDKLKELKDRKYNKTH